MFQFPDVRVGDPVGHGRVRVFPLFRDRQAGGQDYVLADQAMRDGSVDVTEVSDAGSVPELQVENRLDRDVLFLEGEELHGAKQHRVLNTSVLVGAGKTARLPVSCVEAGRWHHESKRFGHRGLHSHPKLRHHLKKGSADSIKRIGRHESDQHAIWEEIRSTHDQLHTPSTTGSLHDSHAAQAQRIEDIRKDLAHVEGAHGMAVAVGGRLTCMDLFDRPETMRKVWRRILSGPVLQSLASGTEEDPEPEKDLVGDLLAELRGSEWEEAKPACDGREYRCRVSEQVEASSLNVEEDLVHCSATVGD